MFASFILTNINFSNILFLIRPQQRNKEHRKLLDSIQRGDEILTSGGIVGMYQD